MMKIIEKVDDKMLMTLSVNDLDILQNLYKGLIKSIISNQLKSRNANK